jgi:methyl-accepting chemotaxis protein
MKFLSITQRLSVIVGLLVLTIIGIVTAESLSFRESMIQERREKIHDMASSVVAMMKRYDGEVAAGHMSLAEAKETVRNAIRGMRWGAGDYYGVYQYDGLTLVHGNPKYENVNRMDFVDGNGVRVVEETINQAKAGGGYSTIFIPRAGETKPAAKIVYVTGYAPWQWALSCGAYVDDVDAIVWHRLAWVAGLAGLAALVAAGLALFIARSISRPIAGLRAAMQSLAGGDTAVTVPFTDWRHETGEIARTVEIFKASMIEGDRLRHEQEELKRRSEAETKSMLNQMAGEFESGVRASLDTLAPAATEMRATSQSMSATAAQTSTQATTVASAAEKASSNVQTVAAAT